MEGKPREKKSEKAAEEEEGEGADLKRGKMSEDKF